MKASKMKKPPHPGFSVRVDCLEPHGLSVTEGAKVLGVSRSALSHLVNESAALSWEMAIRLAKAFGSTPEGWMRLQFQYDATQMEARAKEIKVKTLSEAVSVRGAGIGLREQNSLLRDDALCRAGVCRPE